jgi:hypothetical protein
LSFKISFPIAGTVVGYLKEVLQCDVEVVLDGRVLRLLFRSVLRPDVEGVRPGADVIKLFTAVIYYSSLV